VSARLALGALLLAGCIDSAPIVPVNAANQAAVSACQSTAGVHNGIVIGDIALGASGAGLGASAAALQPSQVTAKNDLALISIGVAALELFGTATASFTSSNFAASKCSSYVGSLPDVPSETTTTGPTTVTVTTDAGAP
jgi:hypothetical protein